MKILFLYLLLAFAICSCTKDNTTDNQEGGGGEDIVLVDRVTASIGVIKDTESTKNLQKLWAVAEGICVVGPNTYKHYQFDGDIEWRNGSFTCVKSEDELPFEYDFEKYYAVTSGGEISVSDKGVLRCYSPIEGTATQKYSANLRDNNPMIATSKDGKSFVFKPVLGYLRVPIMGDLIVKSIELVNNSELFIAGRYYFDMDRPTDVLWDKSVEQKKNIVLDCGDGVQLMDTPTNFYFAIKPMELKKGVTLNITFTDGTSAVQNLQKAITIEPNNIVPTSRFSASSGSTQTFSLKFTGTTFWLPTIEGSNGMSGFIKFGDDTSCPMNTIERYVYTDDDEEHTVSFSVRRATTINIPDCEGITELDLSNF